MAIKNLPTELELQEGFIDFSEYTFELFERVVKGSKYLKFATVSSQVALELFLKYYFLKMGRGIEIQKDKGGVPVPEFKDFSQILAYFYSTRKWSYGKKKELEKLLDARNSIVHRGQSSAWDEDQAENIVRTIFFIHATAWSDLGESILFNNTIPHKISQNPIWRKGAEKFAHVIYKDVFYCIGCGAHAVIDSCTIALDASNSEDDLICLCCLSSVDTFQQAQLIDCYACGEESYYIDALNVQGEQFYVGKCAACETDTWVKKCALCEQFYHPFESDEFIKDNKFFCSASCCEAFGE